MSEHLDYTASILVQNSFVSNGIIFQHRGDLYFLTAGHSIYGKAFDELPEISQMTVETERKVRLNVTQIISDIKFSQKYELGLLRLEKHNDIEKGFRNLKISTRPDNESIDVFFRGNHYDSQQKYTYKEDLKFRDIDVENDYRFDVAIKNDLLTDSNGARGAEWMQGFSGSILFSDKTINLYALGVLFEIPNNGDYSQIKFTGLVPIKEYLPDLDIISFADIPKQFKKRDQISEPELRLFDFQFDDDLYIKREYTNESNQEESLLELDFFEENKPQKSEESLLSKINAIQVTFLLGNPGIGKTIEMKKIVNDVLKNENFLAKYYRINNFTNSDTIKEFLNYSKFEVFDEILFVLDGIDEIPDPKDFLSKLDRFIADLNEKERKHRFVISCRTSIYSVNTFKLTGESKIFRLKGLPLTSAIILLEKFIKKNLSEEELIKVNKLEDFLSNPTKVKLVANYYEQNSRIETNLARLWGTYISTTLNKDTKEKKNRIKTLVPRIKHNATKFAYINELTLQASLDEDQLFRLLLDGESYTELIECAFIDVQTNKAKYFFEDKEVQEYLVAKFIADKSFDFCINFFSIEGTKYIKPTLLNVFTFLINIIPEESEKFSQLVNWIKENSPELFVKADIERIEGLRIPIFQELFYKQQIERTQWVGYNESFTVEELSHFGNVRENFDYLLSIISDLNQNTRARVSAINILKKFSLFDQDSVLEIIREILHSPKENMSYKSSTIDLLVALGLNKDKSVTLEILEIFENESNKKLNRSLLSMIQNVDDVDIYFNYIEREFKWQNGIIQRNDPDKVHRGNSWIMKYIILKLKNQNNFLDLAIYFFDDYRLQTDERFKTELIDRITYFYNNDSLFLDVLIDKLRQDENIRNRHNEEILSELIIKFGYELSAFKKLYNISSLINSSWFLARISNRETIDFFVAQISLTELGKSHLMGFRNIVFNYKGIDLARYFEEKLQIIGIEINDKIPSDEQIEALKKKGIRKVQRNFGMLFNSEGLAKKIKSFYKRHKLEKLSILSIREIEREFYEKQGVNWSAGLDIEFDILFHLVYNYGDFDERESLDILNKSFIVQLNVLKSKLESNKNAQHKFNVSKLQKNRIKAWIELEQSKIDFDLIIKEQSEESFKFNGRTGERMYNSLKTLFYYFELDEYKFNFNQEFLLRSLNFYKMEELDSVSEQYNNLIKQIEDKQLLKSYIEQNLRFRIFSFTAEKQMLYSLRNGFVSVYPRIREFILNSDRISPTDKLFQVYLEKTNDLGILVELSNDLTSDKSWSAMRYLSDKGMNKYHQLCIEKSIAYIDSGETEFRSSALSILFKLNNDIAIDYYIRYFDSEFLQRLPVKYSSGYYLSVEKMNSLIEKLFDLIYSLTSNSDNEWELSSQSEFLTTLLTQTIRNSIDKAEAYFKISNSLLVIISKLSDDDKNYDRKLFYANLLINILEKNYLNAMSEPIDFDKALELTNKLFN